MTALRSPRLRAKDTATTHGLAVIGRVAWRRERRSTGRPRDSLDARDHARVEPARQLGAGHRRGFLRSVNPHFKYIDLNRRGYLLLDVTPQRVVGEWWYVDTVASISNIQTFGVAFEVQHGSNHLQPSAQTNSRAEAPLLP